VPGVEADWCWPARGCDAFWSAGTGDQQAPVQEEEEGCHGQGHEGLPHENEPARRPADRQITAGHDQGPSLGLCFSDYEAIVARVKASHEVALKNGQAIRAKHAKNAADAIDLTTPYSPLEPAQPDPTQSTPQASATAPGSTTSAPNARSLQSFPRRNFRDFTVATQCITLFNSEWMQLEDTTGTPYYVNVATCATQRQAPASGEIVRPSVPLATHDQ
jgi:hypothetical protein